MARVKYVKREAAGSDGGVKKKAKMSAKTSYRSRKSVSTKVSSNNSTRTVVMPYSSRNNAGMTAGTIKSYVVNANDIFTTQPMGRDQMFALYDKAYVKSSSIDVQFVPNIRTSVSTCEAVQMMVWCDTNSSASASEAESVQRCLAHGGKYVVRGYKTNGDGADSWGLVFEPMRASLSDYTKKVTGHGFGSDELSQTASAAPENKWYWHIEAITQTDSPAEPPQLLYQVNFETLFYDPKELAVS